jgi:hypothetical protein
MQLWIVSRTQGKDLLEYMFRNGSNFAMSILDNIAGDAAGLAYDELRFAARNLRCDELWNRMSSRVPKRKAGIPTKEDVDELLELVTEVPLLERLSSLDKQQVSLVLGSGLNWLSCCAAMQKEPVFTPSHNFNSAKEKLFLFFLKDEDLFLLIRLGHQGELWGLDLVCKAESELNSGKS